MPRPRVTFTVDTEKRLVLARFIGELEGSDTVNTTLTTLSDVEAPWIYDHVLDMRRFEGILLAHELEAMASAWYAMTEGRDAGRLSAIITTDPLSHARISLFRTCYPNRIIEIFADFDEGLDWINSQRNDAVQAVA